MSRCSLFWVWTLQNIKRTKPINVKKKEIEIFLPVSFISDSKAFSFSFIVNIINSLGKLLGKIGTKNNLG